MAAAMDAGGYAFVRSHPNANVSLSIFGNVPLGTGTDETSGNWTLILSTCPVSNSSLSLTGYSTYRAEVGETSGHVVGDPNTTSACTSTGILPTANSGGGLGDPSGGGLPPSTPLTSVLSFDGFSESSEKIGGGTFYLYNTTVASAPAAPLVWANLSMFVGLPTTGPVAGATYANITGPTGCSLALFDFTSPGWLPPAANSACPGTSDAYPSIAVGQTIHIVSTVPLSGEGYVLGIVAEPSYSGAEYVLIP
jgi:hypothetical protein